MVDRIVLSPSTSLKVSRPGVDVLSTSNPADLLIGGDWETMGVYATGFVSGVENVFPGKVGYTRRVRMVLPNPTGRIPFVICQGIWSADESRGTTADGNWELFRELANESPVVWYTYAVGVDEQHKKIVMKLEVFRVNLVDKLECLLLTMTFATMFEPGYCNPGAVV